MTTQKKGTIPFCRHHRFGRADAALRHRRDHPRIVPAGQFAGHRCAGRVERDLFREEQGALDGEQDEEVDDHRPRHPCGAGDRVLCSAI